MKAEITSVAVVVPAHDEQDLLPVCLQALRLATDNAGLPTWVVVVADACTDATESVLEAAAVRREIDNVLAVGFGNVGMSRAAGAAAAIARAGPSGLWLLTTDADSLVPPDWIVRHLAHAARGADVVAGTVRPADWEGWSSDLARRYRERYARRVTRHGHDHVHGANLGLRADSYLTLDGFPLLPTGEDVALVRAARGAGLAVTAALDLAVSTSTRHRARAPDGFATHLHGLATEVGP